MKTDTTGGEIGDTGTLEIDTALCSITPLLTEPLVIEFPSVEYTWGMYCYRIIEQRRRVLQH